MTTTLTLTDQDLSLATDLYQLTMAAAYHAAAEESGEMPRATFELWVRKLPDHRRFLVFAGLEQALASLRELSFSYEQVDYLRSLEPFEDVADGYFDALLDFRFRGDVRAMREGTVFFPGEPVLAVTGTIFEAQLVETLLLSVVNHQSAVASKAARLRIAAGDEVKIAEFGSRRAHGPQAAMWSARAAYVGGCDSTSNVVAGHKTGLPVVGTMAHSFVMAHEEEIDAFRLYQRTFPQHTVLLVDTYDTLEGVRRALQTGGPFNGVRLDSGDIGELARQTREILDAGGRGDATIFASGDMNEHKIAALLAAGAPIEAFGVGTQLATSADSPFMNGIYKLVQVERGGEVRPTFKASQGKVTYPGPKQVIREVADAGAAPVMVGDRLIRQDHEDAFPPDQRLLAPVMEAGELVAELPSITEVREHALGQLRRLSDELRSLEDGGESYPVVVDPGLEELLAELEEEMLEA